MPTIDFPAYRERIREDGFIVVPQVFDAEAQTRANAAIDRIYAGGDTSYAALAGERDLLNLLVHPTILTLVGVALHPAIQAQAFHWGVVDAHTEHMGGRWHQDGAMTRHLQVDGIAPMCNMAAGFVFSDQSEPGRGNTRVVPGSHRRALDLSSVPADEAVPGEQPVCADPGDVILFFGGTWHSASPNPSAIQRRIIWSKWNFLWMHQIDPLHRLADDKDWWQTLTPAARQVLGGIYVDRSLYFNPDAAPLHGIVDEALGAPA